MCSVTRVLEYIISKKIREILKQEGKISEGRIEECLPREYKRKYRTESQQNHLSGVQQPELVVSIEGNQISQSDIDSKAPDTEAIERQEDQSPTAGEASHAADVNLRSHPFDKQIGQECTSCLELQDQVTQLKEALQRTSIPMADQIPASEFEFIIPKEKYELVKIVTVLKNIDVTKYVDCLLHQLVFNRVYLN
jgi:hypothetical protein